MNKIIIASAGSGKTTGLIKDAEQNQGNRVLILTFTKKNYEQIVDKIRSSTKITDSNIEVNTWLRFLLSEGVRPYQTTLYRDFRISNIKYVDGKSLTYAGKDDVKNYYIYDNDKIYTDKICDFICKINEDTNGKVINRLEHIYKAIYIDEVQDLAGWDLEFLKLLFSSKIRMYAVGDSRQTTYQTNKSQKNKQYRRLAILELFKKWEQNNLCKITYNNDNFRSNQMICDFSSKLYPDLPSSISKLQKTTEHDGIFQITENDVDEYVKQWSPKILKYDKTTSTNNYESMNFGNSKGLTFDRVLIFPNGTINGYLRNNCSLAEKTLAKLYVAITRARYSVTFVCDYDCCHDIIEKYTISQQKPKTIQLDWTMLQDNE